VLCFFVEDQLKKVHTLLAAASLLAASCASVRDPWTVAFAIADTERAAALVKAGDREYREELVAAGDLAALDRARSYFEAALRYDPVNQEAARYLELVADYRESNAAAALAKARELQKKANRTEDEDYRMYAAVCRAAVLTPKEPEAAKLFKETAVARDALANAWVAKAQKLRAAGAADAAARERSTIEAFQVAAKAAEIDPYNSSALKERDALRSELSLVIDKRIGDLEKLRAAGSFAEARTQTAQLKELNAKAGRTFTEQLTDAEYALYFSWATHHEERKEWGEGEERARQALGLKRTDEAASLLKRLAAARSADERGAGFDTGLKNADAAIARGDLGGAQRAIATLAKAADSAERKQAVDARRKALGSAVAGVYERGVKAYREERFKDAIAALKNVVAVDAAYEDAADYLEKAQDKQKLIDQY
jgi:hypothetical protein